MFENRSYRRLHRKKGLTAFEVTVKETNLNIQADMDLSREAAGAVVGCRQIIEAYIREHPEFSASLSPVKKNARAPELIRTMLAAAQAAGVGPMAAVAGTVAEYTGRKLLNQTRQVMVENGGDIFVKSDTPTVFGIFAGASDFSMSCGIEIATQSRPYSICTSSGTLGHSKSFGRADAAMVFSDSCALADAMATALGNRVETPEDIEPAIAWGKTIDGVRGMVVILGENIGIWGKDLKLTAL